jgi:group I intron endonuclease
MTKRDIETRFTEHKSSARSQKDEKKKCKVLCRSICKYGEENFTIELLEDLGEVTKEEANNAEIFWICHFNTLVPNGLNISKGGDFNKDPTPEEREELSRIARQRYVVHPELREVARQHALSILHSPDVRQKAKEGLQKLYDDPVRMAAMKSKQSLAKKGKKQDPESVEKRAAKMRGTTRQPCNHKYPDDPPHPKYTSFRRNKDGTIQGIMISHPKHPKKSFCSGTIDELIQKAIEYLRTMDS